MWKEKISSIHAYAILIIVAVFTSVYFYIKVINVNTDLENIGQNAGYVMIKVKENSITPKLKSITIGGNGKLQIRGYAPSPWISEGQMTAQIEKGGIVIEKITCFAEGSFVTKTNVPFLCEANAENNGESVYLKITKDYSTGEEGEAKEVIMPIKLENTQS